MDDFVGFNDSAEEEQKSLKYSKIINDLENDILEIESLPNSGEYQYIVCSKIITSHQNCQNHHQPPKLSKTTKIITDQQNHYQPQKLS